MFLGAGLLWWVILGVTMLMSFGAMAYLKSTFASASQVPIASGLTGAQAAARILQSAGINDVEIVEGESFLGDHYDPSEKRLVLSPDNFEGSSAANVGVAAHECGHALQHQQHYIPLEVRMSSVYATNYASQIAMWLPMIAVFTHIISMYTALWVMAACFGVLMFFNLITLPVEFDASARAKKVLQQLGIVRPGPEAAAVNSTLNAAGLTYVAAFIGSLLQFLYYLMLANQRRD
jgi:Zn-dependent membrane protease YugP